LLFRNALLFQSSGVLSGNSLLFLNTNAFGFLFSCELSFISQALGFNFCSNALLFKAGSFGICFRLTRKSHLRDLLVFYR